MWEEEEAVLDVDVTDDSERKQRTFANNAGWLNASNPRDGENNHASSRRILHVPFALKEDLNFDIYDLFDPI